MLGTLWLPKVGEVFVYHDPVLGDRFWVMEHWDGSNLLLAGGRRFPIQDCAPATWTPRLGQRVEVTGGCEYTGEQGRIIKLCVTGGMPWVQVLLDLRQNTLGACLHWLTPCDKSNGKTNEN